MERLCRDNSIITRKAHSKSSFLSLGGNKSHIYFKKSRKKDGKLKYFLPLHSKNKTDYKSTIFHSLFTVLFHIEAFSRNLFNIHSATNNSPSEYIEIIEVGSWINRADCWLNLFSQYPHYLSFFHIHISKFQFWFHLFSKKLHIDETGNNR